MKLLEECITFFENELDKDILKDIELYKVYKSSLYHLKDYRDLLQIACCNSVDFDSFKTKKEFNDRDKDLC